MRRKAHPITAECMEVACLLRQKSLLRNCVQKLGDRAAWGGALPFEVKDARQVEGAGVPWAKWSLKEF